ncbi:MAG: methylmalonyl-CoA mutase family protein, partial [Gemmatimonadota bacterium]
VGVNDFIDTDGEELEILTVSEEPEAIQRERLASLRSRRDEARVEHTLTELRGAAERDENVMPPMLDCARAYCTLYEIRHTLEEVYGAYREPVFF